MRSRILILMLTAVMAFGANVRLYLKDGTYQLVREYQVMGDNVHYYSAERETWEDIPLDLIDLDRTKKEVADREASLKQEAKEDDEEDAALKAERDQIARIPQNVGVYYIQDSKLQPLKQAEISIVNDKKRSILQVLSPVPVVPGKSTVEIDGAAAQFRVADNRPEFYFRMNNPEALAIIKLDPKKNLRVAETVSKQQLTEDVQETRQTVDTFKKGIGDTLYKIWPEKPLPPGEYAVVEYTETAINLQAWDFGVGPLK